MKTQTKALTIAIAPKTIVYLGASSSPQRAHIVSVSADKVTYVTYPYYELRQEDIRIFRHLAQVGTQTEVDHLTAMREAKKKGDRFAFYTDHLDKLRDELANLLNGIVTTEHDYTQDQRIKVYLLPEERSASADHWSYIILHHCQWAK